MPSSLAPLFGWTLPYWSPLDAQLHSYLRESPERAGKEYGQPVAVDRHAVVGPSQDTSGRDTYFFPLLFSRLSRHGDAPFFFLIGAICHGVGPHRPKE